MASPSAPLRRQLRVMRQQPRGSFATRHRARCGASRDVSVSYQVLNLCGRLVALVSHRDRTELDTALRETEEERFLDTYRRLGPQPFKDALYGTA